MNKKKWLKLTLIATALLLIPRRSSQQSCSRQTLTNTDNEESQADATSDSVTVL